VERQVVPHGGTRNRKRPPADCIYIDERAECPDNVRYRRPQPSSGCHHVGNAGESRLWVGRRGAVDRSIRHNCQFEGDTFWGAQPVKADERWGNVF